MSLFNLRRPLSFLIDSIKVVCGDVLPYVEPVKKRKNKSS